MLDLTKEYLQQLNERIDAGKDSELRASLEEELRAAQGRQRELGDRCQGCGVARRPLVSALTASRC